MCDMCPPTDKDVLEIYERELEILPRLREDLDRREETAKKMVARYRKKLLP